MADKEKDVKLNNQTLTESEFKEKKEELESKPGITLVKVAEDSYKTQIQG